MVGSAPFGPTPLPLSRYRNLLVADSGVSSDAWDVGENVPGCAGWSVEFSVVCAAGARIVGDLDGFGRWQGPAAVRLAEDFDLTLHGRVWVPWSRWRLTLTDLGAAGAGNDSTAHLFAVQVPINGTVPSPILFGRTVPATIALGGTTVVPVQTGASAYRIGINPSPTWAGPLVVDERSSVAGGGAKINVGQGVYSQAGSGAQLDRGGWREVPSGPAPDADLSITNTDPAVAVGVTVHWQYDLSRGR